MLVGKILYTITQLVSEKAAHVCMLVAMFFLKDARDAETESCPELHTAPPGGLPLLHSSQALLPFSLCLGSECQSFGFPLPFFLEIDVSVAKIERYVFFLYSAVLFDQLGKIESRLFSSLMGFLILSCILLTIFIEF